MPAVAAATITDRTAVEARMLRSRKFNELAVTL